MTGERNLIKVGYTWAVIDEGFFEALSDRKWSLDGYGYAVSTAKRSEGNLLPSGEGRQIKMHRVVLGEVNPRIFVDHRNLDKLDNQTKNLRRCNRKGLNTANKPKPKDCHSIYKGVTKSGRESQPWSAQCCGRNLGRFESEIEAARAYDAAAVVVLGEFARLNFTERNYMNG